MKSTLITTSNDQMDRLSGYVACQHLSKLYPNLLTNNQVAWLMRNRETNGLKHCVVKLGKRLYIHLPSFQSWLEREFDVEFQAS